MNTEIKAHIIKQLTNACSMAYVMERERIPSFLQEDEDESLENSRLLIKGFWEGAVEAIESTDVENVAAMLSTMYPRAKEIAHASGSTPELDKFFTDTLYAWLDESIGLFQDPALIEIEEE